MNRRYERLTNTCPRLFRRYLRSEFTLCLANIRLPFIPTG
jgi:hypothetical protein